MTHEVLIVGAGPTGLSLALWLSKQGVRPRIISAAKGPGTTSRAMAVQARTLELYRQLDLADRAVANGKSNAAFNIWVKGKRRARVLIGDAGKTLTPYPFLLVYPQDRHERMLVDRLRDFGVEVEWNTELVRFEENGDRVIAHLSSSEAGSETCEVHYLAGCDGARSTVRKEIGSGFPGGTYEQTFYVADAEIGGAVADGEVHVALDSADFAMVMSYDDHGGVRLIGTVTQDSTAKDLSFDDVSHEAIDRLGLKIKKVNWFSTYRVHHRVTNRYRVGRAFLLGDAAHVHSPAGGQGMNTGIGDAINLAWKLAMVIKERAPQNLLDSYEKERRAFAEKLVQTTDRLFTFATATGGFADFVRTRIAPLFIPFAYRADAVREYMFRVVSQTMIEYRDSPVSEGATGGVHGGDRLPWVRTASSDNYDSLTKPVWQVHVYGTAEDDLVRWCAARHIPLQQFEWDDAYREAGLQQNGSYFIRPDTYLACVAETDVASTLDRYCDARGLVFALEAE